MANCILRTVTHIVQGNHCPIFLLIIGYSQGQQRSAKKQEILAAEKSTIQLARAADVPGVRDAAWCGASTAKIWQLVSQQQPKHSVGPVSDSKSTEDFEFWTWFEPCFLLLQLELHVSTLAVAANEEVAESNARMTSLAGYSGLSSMTLWILWICIFSLGWRNPWCQFPASGSSLWTIPYLSGRWVYTFLFFGVIHRYRWHIWQFGMDYASWQLNIFQKMRPFKSYLPSVTLHPNANKSQSLNTSPKGPSNAKTEQCSAGAIDSDGSALPLNCKLPFICKFPIAPRLRGRAWRHNFAN